MKINKKAMKIMRVLKGHSGGWVSGYHIHTETKINPGRFYEITNKLINKGYIARKMMNKRGFYRRIPGNERAYNKL